MNNQVITKTGMTYPKTFTAIDFEIATTKNERQICQIGMTIVQDGKITDVITEFVRPYMNQYDEICSGIHGINPLMTEDCPDFREVWDKVSQLIIGPLIAHNASFDRSVLTSNVDFYGMDYEVPKFKDTHDIFPGSIDLILDFLGMDSSMHHNAEFDSRICAELMLAANGLGSFADGIDPDDLISYKEQYKSKYSKSRGLYSAKEISKEFRIKNTEDCEDKSNIFFDKIVVITGDFPIFRNDLAEKIHSMGAKINQSISSKTDYVLVGINPGWSKMEKVEKLQQANGKIQIISLDMLKEMNII